MLHTLYASTHTHGRSAGVILFSSSGTCMPLSSATLRSAVQREFHSSRKSGSAGGSLPMEGSCLANRKRSFFNRTLLLRTDMSVDSTKWDIWLCCSSCPPAQLHTILYSVYFHHGVFLVCLFLEHRRTETVEWKSEQRNPAQLSFTSALPCQIDSSSHTTPSYSESLSYDYTKVYVVQPMSPSRQKTSILKWWSNLFFPLLFIKTKIPHEARHNQRNQGHSL